MKKLLILAVVALLGANIAKAQSALIATLAHEGEVTIFSGSSALIEAHKAAVNGDIITLSPGSFTAVDITKGVTIRGAGMFPEDNGTNILGDTFMKNGTSGATLEGLCFTQYFYLANVTESTFSKCNFVEGIRVKKSLSNYDYGLMSNCKFINCFINYADLSVTDNTNSAFFTNCYVNNPTFRDTTKGTYTFDNCYILLKSGVNRLPYSTIKNSIISTNASFASTTTIIHCHILLPEATQNTTAKSVTVNCTLHKGVPAELWKDESRLVLNDSFASTWLGNDGTQVGIHGGILPFDPLPSGPQITKFNVGKKTSADGKLTIDIEVKTAD